MKFVHQPSIKLGTVKFPLPSVLGMKTKISQLVLHIEHGHMEEQPLIRGTVQVIIVF